MKEGKFWQGKKKTGILIIQGWTSFTRQVNPIARILNKMGYWVHVPVLSGHNTKPEELEGVTWKNWNKDALEAIDLFKKKSGVNKIFLLGVSFGGNLAILASKKQIVSGVVLVSTPIFLRDHYWTILGARILSVFKKTVNKKYPKELNGKLKPTLSYNYFPIKSSFECFKLIKKSRQYLRHVNKPFSIIQTNKDYLVATYSPWLIYNRIKSHQKSLHWVDAGEGVHIDFSVNPKQYAVIADNFIKKTLKNNK